MRTIPIEADELMAGPHTAVARVEAGTLFEVRHALGCFVLGPGFPGLFEHYGPEYGWPARVDLEALASIDQLVPGRRRHPTIWRDGKPVAMAIMTGEFEDYVRQVVGSIDDR